MIKSLLRYGPVLLQRVRKRELIRNKLGNAKGGGGWSERSGEGILRDLGSYSEPPSTLVPCGLPPHQPCVRAVVRLGGKRDRGTGTKPFLFLQSKTKRGYSTTRRHVTQRARSKELGKDSITSRRHLIVARHSEATEGKCKEKGWFGGA